MDVRLTDSLFSQVIPLHLQPAFSFVEIFHLHHMEKIKFSLWKVRNSLQSDVCIKLKLWWQTNSGERKRITYFLSDTFLVHGSVQVIHILCVCCLTRCCIMDIFLLTLGSLKALADIICEYPSIHKRYPAKCYEKGKCAYFVKSFALITLRNWQITCSPVTVSLLWSGNRPVRLFWEQRKALVLSRIAWSWNLLLNEQRWNCLSLEHFPHH